MTRFPKLNGLLLIGAIDSLGVRRDADAVAPLTGHLQDKDAAVASATAAALGKIGNANAAKALEQSLASAPPKVRSAVAEGLVLCAERLLAKGQDAPAVAIYDEVRKADVSKQRILEATRGAILARKQEGIALLLEQLRSPEKHMFQMALGTAREFPGAKVDEALAAELDRATPAGRARDRRDDRSQGDGDPQCGAQSGRSRSPRSAARRGQRIGRRGERLVPLAAVGDGPRVGFRTRGSGQAGTRRSSGSRRRQRYRRPPARGAGKDLSLVDRTGG